MSLRNVWRGNLQRCSIGWRLDTAHPVDRGDSHLLSGPKDSKRFFRTLKTRLLLRQFEGFLSPGQRVHEYLRWYGVPDYRVFRVPHAVDNDMFAAAAARFQHPEARAAARQRLGIAPDAFVPLF